MDFESVKTDMEFLGTYKKEFDRAIEVYIDIYEQYQSAWKDFIDNGKQTLIECRGGYKKNPITMTLESLRKEFLTYSDRLGLNPKALDQIKNAQVPKEMTALETFMSNFNGQNKK